MILCRKKRQVGDGVSLRHLIGFGGKQKASVICLKGMSRRKHEDNYATIDHVIPKSLGWLILSVNLIDNKN